jgi:hypothetical protein
MPAVRKELASLQMSTIWARQFRYGSTRRVAWKTDVTGMPPHPLSEAGADEAILQAGYDVQARKALSGAWRTREDRGMATP